MSDTRMDGSFRVEPPLNHKDIKKIEALGARHKINDALNYHIEEETTETDEGILTKRSCSEISPARPDSGWGVEEALRGLLNMFPDRVWRGCLDCVSEEVDISDIEIEGIWRYVIFKDELVKVEPTIRWNYPNLEEN